MIKTNRNMERPAILGAIRIGERKLSKGGKLFPAQCDHFRIVSGRTADGMQNLDMDLMERLDPENKEPREIRVYLFFKTVEENFITERTMYGKMNNDKNAPTVRKCYCDDGENAHRINKDGTTKVVTCKGDDCQFAISKECKPLGTLFCTIDKSNQIGGVYKYQTTSWNSIRQIQTSLDTIYNISGGVLSGLPLTLVVKPHVLQTPSAGAQTKYLVNIEFHGDHNAFIDTIKQLIGRGNEQHAQLTQSSAKLAIEDAKTPEAELDTAEEFCFNIGEPVDDGDVIELNEDEAPQYNDEGQGGLI